MLDSKIRPYIDPPLNASAAFLVRRGVSADAVTIAGIPCALAAFIALSLQLYGTALVFVLLNRLTDGLDGPVARHSDKGATDHGAFIDIVSDFVFYAGVPFFFAVGRPETALAAAFLIFTFIGTATSFLTYGIINTKKNVNHQEQGKKSFYYAAGLCEGTETILFLVLFCLMPEWFVPLAILFGVLCLITTGGRIMRAVRDFD